MATSCAGVSWTCLFWAHDVIWDFFWFVVWEKWPCMLRVAMLCAHLSHFGKLFVSGAPAEARRCAPHFLEWFFWIKFFTMFWCLQAERFEGRRVLTSFNIFWRPRGSFFAQLWPDLLTLAVKPWPLFRLEQRPLKLLNFFLLRRKLARTGVLAVTCLGFCFGSPL